MADPLPKRIDSILDEAESDFSETTLRVYRAAWRDLLKWWLESLGEDDIGIESVLQKHGVPLLPFEAIAAYLKDRADLAWSTLTSRRQAIRLVYSRFDALDPFEQLPVENAWRRIRKRKRDEKPKSDSKPKHRPAEVIEKGLDLLHSHLENLREDRSEEEMSPYELMRKDFGYLPHKTVRTDSLDPDQQKLIPEPTYDLQVLRNRALLLLVAASGAARAQLAGISLEDTYFYEQEEEPVRVVLRDDEGRPESVLRLSVAPELRFCPARALASWIVAAEIEGGPVFRSFTPHGKPKDTGIRPQSINHVIQRRAEMVDSLAPSEWSTRRVRIAQ
jgi:hypothetical protein